MWCAWCDEAVQQEKSGEAKQTPVKSFAFDEELVIPPRSVIVENFSPKSQGSHHTLIDGLSPKVDEPVTLVQVDKVDCDDEADKAEALQWEARGVQAFARKDLDAAISSYCAALRLNKESPTALAGRGGAYLRKGMYDLALADLDRALKLDPYLLNAKGDRAEVKLKVNDIDGALADYSSKLELVPCDGRALCGRAEARMRKGDKEGAVADLKVAVKLAYPGSEQALHEALHGAVGDTKKAKGDAKRGHAKRALGGA